ncbi:MAG TPA: hypothetical protein PLS53_06960 [Thermoanaerobaculaceae bacterium]|nr:hypothetical protein [Thermoanaerobaculaceae bacterium]HPS77875.1 hypothetical protein [Thermoanaerobaculaceae bacterium]
MNAAGSDDLTVALVFRLAIEPPAALEEGGAARPGRPLRLGWAIVAGGSPILTLDCRVPPGVETGNGWIGASLAVGSGRSRGWSP